jgi:hypothetical protein
VVRRNTNSSSYLITSKGKDADISSNNNFFLLFYVTSEVSRKILREFT